MGTDIDVAFLIDEVLDQGAKLLASNKSKDSAIGQINRMLASYVDNFEKVDRHSFTNLAKKIEWMLDVQKNALSTMEVTYLGTIIASLHAIAETKPVLKRIK